MTKKAIKSKDDPVHMAKVNKAKAEKALADKKFHQLSDEEKDDLLKLLALKFHLIKPD